MSLVGRIAVIAALALLAVPACAQAAFPGQNGRIAYDPLTCSATCEESGIWTVNPDGTDPLQLTATGKHPAWSSDGQRIAFARSDGLFVMNADGSGLTPVIGLTPIYGPTWSPDSQRLAFNHAADLWTVRIDGTDLHQVTHTAVDEGAPEWSPDGESLLVAGGQVVRTVDPDSGATTTLLDVGGFNFVRYATWAPDGKHFAFVFENWCDGDFGTRVDTARNDGSERQYVFGFSCSGGPVGLPAWSPDGARIAAVWSEIFTVKTDGTDYISVGGDHLLQSLDWQPLPVNTPSTYARPKAATPVRTALVPAYPTCSSPNRVHGGSLNYASCSPPQHLSPTLTVGVGDGSPAFSRSVGWVQLTARPGVPGGADDADMAIRLSITNVMRKSDLSDYTGELGVDLSFQMTDREGPVSQTSMASGGSFTAPCTATESTIDGATCAVDTTVEALIPAAITEGARAIFELGPIKVRDGGPDEDADTPAADGLLATQGVFVP